MEKVFFSKESKNEFEESFFFHLIFFGVFNVQLDGRWRKISTATWPNTIPCSRIYKTQDRPTPPSLPSCQSCPPGTTRLSCERDKLRLSTRGLRRYKPECQR
jgi:hypothetical protein